MSNIELSEAEQKTRLICVGKCLPFTISLASFIKPTSLPCRIALHAKYRLLLSGLSSQMKSATQGKVRRMSGNIFWCIFLIVLLKYSRNYIIISSSSWLQVAAPGSIAPNNWPLRFKALSSFPHSLVVSAPTQTSPLAWKSRRGEVEEQFLWDTNLKTMLSF